MRDEITALNKAQREFFTDLQPGDAREWEFELTITCTSSGISEPRRSHTQHAGYFADFASNYINAKGPPKTPPKTRHDAEELWTTMLSAWRQRFLNPPPEHMIAAWMAKSTNATMVKCLDSAYHGCPEWNDELLANLKEVTSPHAGATLSLQQYLTWREAATCALDKGLSYEEAARLGSEFADDLRETENFKIARSNHKEWLSTVTMRVHAHVAAVAAAAREAARAASLLQPTPPPPSPAPPAERPCAAPGNLEAGDQEGSDADGSSSAASAAAAGAGTTLAAAALAAAARGAARAASLPQPTPPQPSPAPPAEAAAAAAAVATPGDLAAGVSHGGDGACSPSCAAPGALAAGGSTTVPWRGSGLLWRAAMVISLHYAKVVMKAGAMYGRYMPVFTTPKGVLKM